MRTLLLADESVTVQRVIALTFADEPIRVIACGDGPQAIERMAVQRPDIVLAATTLPQVSGYDLAQFMRSKPELRDVPVLLLAGAFETVDDARLAVSGANGVIEKPVEPNNVIGRVKQLLGLKSEAKPETTGRQITSAEGTPDQKLPVATPPESAPAAALPPTEPRESAGLGASVPSVAKAPIRSNDYLDRLEGALDSLDQQISGGAANPRGARNPAGPHGQAAGAPDPRSPGRPPQDGASAPGYPVFEVDDDWFVGDENEARAAARAGRREIEEDLRAPELQAPVAAAPQSAVFEVDADWFADDDKSRAANRPDELALAADMGIHDIELPDAMPVATAAAPVSDGDVAFGADDGRPLQEAAPPSLAAASSAASRDMADDFAQLLAFEQGEHREPPAAPAIEVRLVAPEITDEMLDQIAARVADRLNAGVLGEQLTSAMTATVREIVSDTSERLVRDEIERIKSKART